jgi:hypothetical protein
MDDGTAYFAVAVSFSYKICKKSTSSVNAIKLFFFVTDVFEEVCVLVCHKFLKDATTFSITTLSVTTFSKMALRKWLICDIEHKYSI